MKAKIFLPITLLSLSLLFGCSSDDTQIESVEDKEQLMLNTEMEESSEGNEEEALKTNPLFDTSKLEEKNINILINNKLIEFQDTISNGPLANESDDILVDFETVYNALGFDTEINKSEADINAVADDGSRNVYIAINIEKNIKSISINHEDTSNSEETMYVFSDMEKNKTELLVSLEFIAKTINSSIIQGETKNSLVLNDKLKFPDIIIEEEKEDSKENKANIAADENQEKSPQIFDALGIKIGDPIEQAINVFGTSENSGSYQGSTYHSFDDITIYVDKKDVIQAINIFTNKHSIDGIKVGDSVEKIFKKTKEEIESEKIDGQSALYFDDYKGYKVEFTLKEDKETIQSITVYNK